MKTIQVIEGSEEYQVIHIRENGDGSLVEVQVSVMKLNLYFPQSKWQEVTAYFLYEPIMGNFCWQTLFSGKLPDEYVSRIDYFIENKILVVLKNKIVIFSLSESVLLIIDSNDRYESFEQARASVLLNLENKLEALHRGEVFFIFKREEYKELGLCDYINREFFELRGYCGGGDGILPAKMIGIKYHDSQWQIELEGNDNRKIPFTGVKMDQLGSVPRVRATVLLNDNYEVIEVIAEDFVKQLGGIMR